MMCVVCARVCVWRRCFLWGKNESGLPNRGRALLYWRKLYVHVCGCFCARKEGGGKHVRREGRVANGGRECVWGGGRRGDQKRFVGGGQRTAVWSKDGGWGASASLDSVCCCEILTVCPRLLTICRIATDQHCPPPLPPCTPHLFCGSHTRLDAESPGH